jgi:hypothetical protein
MYPSGWVFRTTWQVEQHLVERHDDPSDGLDTVLVYLVDERFRLFYDRTKW